MASVSRAYLFLIVLGVGFLLPAALPKGLDTTYLFILGIVLFAWFVIKWDAVKSLTERSNRFEALAGATLIGADYAYNVVMASPVGLVDLLVIMLGSVVLVFGVKALRLFWVPVVYGVVLLLGYQIENYLPNYVALQDWLAAVMASCLGALGIAATVSGHLVGIMLSDGTRVTLDISTDCTGLQGILAFGLLSTMALIGLKPRLSKTVILFAVGFLGAFLINIVRLLVVFLTFEYFGTDLGTQMHVYFGYLIFIAWVLVFWALAFQYLVPPRGSLPQQTAFAPKGRTNPA